MRNFFTVLDWRSLEPGYVTPPPVLSIYTDEELRDYNNLVFPNFKCHNQECEHVMQDIEKSVGSNIGYEKQKASLVCTVNNAHLSVPHIIVVEFFSLNLNHFPGELFMLRSKTTS